MKIFHYLLLLFFGLGSQAQNTWLTDYSAALEQSKLQGKNILLEAGSISGEYGLFIADEVWEDPKVQDELQDYIPVSVVLKNTDPLIEKFNIQFTPCVLVVTPNEKVLFKDSGRKEVEELSNILQYVSSPSYYKIIELERIYANDNTPLGELLKMEEYLKLSIGGPYEFQRFAFNRVKDSHSILYSKESELNASQQQRLEIMSLSHDIFRYYENENLKKLYKIGRKDLKASNHSLLLFLIVMAEFQDGKEDRAKEIFTELEKRMDKDRRTAGYIKIFKSQF